LSRYNRASTSQPFPEKKKILVVNDEPDVTNMLKMTLERVGFRVDTFNDPVLALKDYKPNMYDLVILDVIMPELDGLELYTQLKSKDSGINICFLTASSEPYREELLKEKYNQLSRDLFLEMPLPTSELIREVKKRIQYHNKVSKQQ
jgi:DNA-binding response OmpR family regulator